MRGLAPQPTPVPIAAGLPAVLAADDYARRFTEALDAVLSAAVVAYDNLPAYLDPGTAPADFLGWLGHWVCAPADDRDGADRESALRALLPASADLGARRGTVGALAEEISLLCGVDVEVHDGGGVVTGAAPGTAPGAGGSARVEVVVHGACDRTLVRRLVRRATPAHLPVDVVFVARTSEPDEPTTEPSEPTTPDLRGGDPS